MMMRPSEFQTAFRFAAYGFLGNPLHSQGVLFMMGSPTLKQHPTCCRFFRIYTFPIFILLLLGCLFRQR